MIPFFVDVFTDDGDPKAPLVFRDIKAIGMGYPGDSNDLVIEVVTPGSYVDGDGENRQYQMAMTFRNRVRKVGGNSVGHMRSPMLGVRLVGWNVRSMVWPRLAYELFIAKAPLYNFFAPLSRRYNDCDMADLRMILTQGAYMDGMNDMSFTSFTSALGYLGETEYRQGDDDAAVKEKMERRIDMISDVYGRYVELSGKE